MNPLQVIENHLQQYQEALGKIEQKVASLSRMLRASDPDWDGPILRDQLLSLLTLQDTLFTRVNALQDVLKAIEQEGEIP